VVRLTGFITAHEVNTAHVNQWKRTHLLSLLTALESSECSSSVVSLISSSMVVYRNIASPSISYWARYHPHMSASSKDVSSDIQSKNQYVEQPVIDTYMQSQNSFPPII
jgi:hypothetical protein